MTVREKACLSIITAAPLSSSTSAEALELLLVAAAFDIPTSLLFAGAGVLNLVPEQNAKGLARKTPSKQLGALELYGVQAVYACRASMERHGVFETAIDVAHATREDVQGLLSDHDIILCHR